MIPLKFTTKAKGWRLYSSEHE